MKNNVVIIMCPPLLKYPEKPEDISESAIVDCPKCNQKMWFSIKKKQHMKMMEDSGKEIIFACHDCIQRLINSLDAPINITAIDI